MKNMVFRKVLYVLSILTLVISGVTFFTLSGIVQWYSKNIIEILLMKEVIVFLYLTLVPFIFILWAVNRLSFNLLKDNCFNEQSLKQLKLINICSLIDFVIYLAGTIFIFRTAVCFVLTLATLLVATLSWIIKELVTNGIELKEENDLTI